MFQLHATKIRGGRMPVSSFREQARKMLRIVNSNDATPQVPAPADGMMQFTRDDLPGMVIECDIDTWFLIQRVELDAADDQVTPSAASSPLPCAPKHTEACSSAPVSLPHHGINLNSTFDDVMIINRSPIKSEKTPTQPSAAAAASSSATEAPNRAPETMLSGEGSRSPPRTTVAPASTSANGVNEERIGDAVQPVANQVASSTCSISEAQQAPEQSPATDNAHDVTTDEVGDEDSGGGDDDPRDPNYIADAGGESSDNSSDSDSSSSDDELLLQPKSPSKSREVRSKVRPVARTPGYTATDYSHATGYSITLALHDNGEKYVYFNSIRTKQPSDWQRNYAKLVEGKHMCRLSVYVKTPSGSSIKVTGLFISTVLISWLHSPSTSPPSKISEVFQLRGSTSHDMLQICIETLEANGFRTETLPVASPQQALPVLAAAASASSSSSSAFASTMQRDATALSTLFSSTAASSSLFATMPPLEPAHAPNTHRTTPPATLSAAIGVTANVRNSPPPTTPSQSPRAMIQTQVPLPAATTAASVRSPEPVAAARTSQRTTNGLLYANALSGDESKYTFYTIIDGHGFVVIDALLRPLCRLNHLIPEVQGMVRAGILQRCTIWIPQLQVTEPRILLRSRYLSHVHYCNGDPIYNQAYSYIRSKLDHEKLRQAVQSLIKNNLLIFNKPSLKRQNSAGSNPSSSDPALAASSAKRAIVAGANGSPRAVSSTTPSSTGSSNADSGATTAAANQPQQRAQAPLTAATGGDSPSQFGTIIPKVVIRVRGFLMRAGDANTRVLGRPLITVAQQAPAPLVVAVQYAQEPADARLVAMAIAARYNSCLLYTWTPILIVDPPSRLANMQWVIHIHGRHGDTATIPLPSGDALPFADSWINTVLMPDILSFIDSRWMRHTLPGESIGSFMASCSATTYSVRK
jgi:hypothetical protein